MGSLSNKFNNFCQNDRVLPSVRQDIENIDKPISIQQVSSLRSDTCNEIQAYTGSYQCKFTKKQVSDSSDNC